MKPHHQIPIVECHEPLVPVPKGWFALEDPHPYVKLGAPYHDKSPYYLRQTVLEQLIAAQTRLQQDYPGWRIQIFDAYRPLAVQQFMVDHTFEEMVRSRGLNANQLSEPERQALLQQVYQFWAIPSADPATPPPHSTGAAVDVTLVDEHNSPIDMGSPIDEMSLRSYPDYFSPTFEPPTAGEISADLPGRPNVTFHQNRQILRDAMTSAGFLQHPNEWWHFSWGDQMWMWLTQQHHPDRQWVARYGAIAPVNEGFLDQEHLASHRQCSEC
ncbi:M15 family metallopeptidase [Oscillatoria sp. FACHB-1407]|uniref:M15 family metallopeptidase n=1 Tax=Oscillatoria sp. FACHB-1407 TaxID=2692847 RepID=UPI0016852C00|nr:M15 family metallopeptidase [Oscillatoria sp. FACHB-1407]MBD2460177.1 M15 family metallopeptidase [Oscillatoria sp. FACHB-1407]